MSDPFFAAEIDHNISTIDLHNTTEVFSALEQLERELFLFGKSEMRYCRVVHGIGKGVLANAVHDALIKNPMVHEYKCVGGSCLVLF
ncbi:MAG: Smr/MutS family protein [Candidatus Magasanikbacteria bacterium]|jgi:dsDNA-specific endonuclease/ATPase MutS2|nr:Smr/MutS family protein [Candidatus Magasanikbacteria bacterium]MBT4221020.1 Smr/MutS family protein [Candidatus Magasanikbacteria bacterium]MBT4350538.1 Smr/MutS family protein [Candidatus Magasanikbacteria bacterium]MBT4541909.1 Smr/MutS family protein [Candidatus Magasanikbacteria bacterium]MBT6253040.1 Smr/MutS family protein [Candidatus Magasanikbacteria bacterium]